MLRVLWGRPCEELCGLEHSITPLRKLLCLTRTIKLIFENLKVIALFEFMFPTPFFKSSSHSLFGARVLIISCE